MTFGEPLSWLARYFIRRAPDPLDVVKLERKDAELQTLASISRAEYAALRVDIHKRTAQYHQDRAVRLQEYIAMKEAQQDEGVVIHPIELLNPSVFKL